MKSNFSYSFFFLPPREKEALLSFYAFCRKIDDETDHVNLSKNGRKPLETLHNWRVELAHCFNGIPSHPLMKKLYPFIQSYHLSQVYFEEIINGMEMDLLKSSYLTFEELKLYCYRVASAVGLVCMEIFNDRSASARECAVDLGIAFQLTNILRDLYIDLKQGRIYLPQEDLIKFDYSEEDLRKSLKSSAFLELIHFEINRAKSYYQKGEKNLRDCQSIGKSVILVMMKTYFQLLLQIEKEVLNLDRKVVSLSPLNRLRIAGGIWFNHHLKH